MSDPVLTAADLTVVATLDRDGVTIGDVAELTVSVGHPSGTTVAPPHRVEGEQEIPLSAGSLLGTLEAREILGPEPRTLEGGRAETRYRVRLSTLEPGDHAVEGLRVRVAAPGGEPLAAQVPPVTLRVASVLEGVAEEDLAKADIREIKAPLPVAPDYTLYAYAALALAAAAILALLVARLVRRRGRVPAPARPALPPEVEAVTALDALRDRKLPAQGCWKEFALELSEIVRRYAGRRFDVHALEHTSREILRDLSESQGFLALPDRDRTGRRLEGLLDETDLVKFARHTPALSVEGDLLSAAYAFVEETRPRPAVPAAPPVAEEALAS